MWGDTWSAIRKKRKTKNKIHHIYTHKSVRVCVPIGIILLTPLTRHIDEITGGDSGDEWWRRWHLTSKLHFTSTNIHFHYISILRFLPSYLAIQLSISFYLFFQLLLEIFSSVCFCFVQFCIQILFTRNWFDFSTCFCFRFRFVFVLFLGFSPA